VIVLDSSATVEYVALRGHAGWVERVIEDDPDVHSPHLLDVEVASALRKLVRRGELRGVDARRALSDLAELDIARYPHLDLLDRMWELRSALTPYDAAYVALAELLDANLVTTDARLARSHGHRARILAP
jgi:predicted nucleic acid-binding protein